MLDVTYQNLTYQNSENYPLTLNVAKYLLHFLLIISHKLNCPITLPLLTSKSIRHYRNNSELKLRPQNKGRLCMLGYSSKVPCTYDGLMVSNDIPYHYT